MQPWMWLTLAGLGYVGWIVIKSRARSARAKAYQDALAALAADSSNNQLRVGALEAGRRHYGGLRKDGAPTIYDEAAINNDVLARTGSSK